MGLRLVCGVEKTSLEQVFNKEFTQIFSTSAIKKLLQQELIIINEKYLAINEKYQLLTNEIIAKICLAIKE
jgi:coproporphyrinogen III oxidase-like Fe-S oxidoreductase